jgi:hypothetical protein
MFKQKIDVLQNYRSLQALQFSYKLYLHPISYVKVMILLLYYAEKKSGTRIRPEYKTTRICIRKNGYLHYPYPVPDG